MRSKTGIVLFIALVSLSAAQAATSRSRGGPNVARIKAMMAEENWPEALHLLANYSDPSSRTLRAAVYEKLGYSHAALAELAASYHARPNALVLNRLGGLAFLLGETRLIQGLPVDTLGMHLASSQEALMAGDITKARNMLPATQQILNLDTSPIKEHAMIMASAIYNATGNPREALMILSGAFPQTSNVDLAEIRLQRASILYDVGKYGDALEELRFITRSSPTWYRGQLIGAWAAFQVDDYNLALGQLMNLHSPFLAGKFNPEKYLLKAVVLFQLCHYASAQRTLQKLHEDYGKMNGAFQHVAAMTEAPARFYSAMKVFATGEEKTENSAVDRVWDGIASQPIVATLSNSIEKLRFERKNLGPLLSARETQGQRSFLMKVFERVEETYLAHLSHYARSEVEKMKGDVKQSIEGSLAVDLEINTRLRERLMRAQAPVQKNIDFQKEVEKGYEFWPFEGEFWRDETGGYAFATTDVCEEGVR